MLYHTTFVSDVDGTCQQVRIVYIIIIIIIKYISDKTSSIYIYIHKIQFKKYEKYNTYNTIKAIM